jgi:hypothetical protein
VEDTIATAGGVVAATATATATATAEVMVVEEEMLHFLLLYGKTK